MVPKILNPKVKRIVVYTTWILLIIPLLSTYFLISDTNSIKTYILIGLYVVLWLAAILLYVIHFFLHIKSVKQLNEKYQLSEISEGLKKSKEIDLVRIQDNFLYKQEIKTIIHKSHSELQNLDKRFNESNFYQEYQVDMNNKQLRIACLEFCKKKYLINYPHNYDCYYWIELDNINDQEFVLLNNKESINPTFNGFLIKNLIKKPDAKFTTYTKDNNFDVRSVIKSEILDDLLFKNDKTNINLINKNNKTFLLVRMSFNIFNLYYGSDYFDEKKYHDLTIQRIENIKNIIDLFYSLRECFNYLEK
ncbi:hypothetical protein [Mycoplasma sp. E35C]|uniref:hypothetical protein n=1 Tax=Mycoplasma sp. E35C TaxID=2801918 RepID=UPI001CA3CA5F|nr:hypothetical protein [Mycoplasma sp. E35C]QZX49169.1 hypothetical protein JJE79_00110 [Mycoplasma sp. E35C]